MGRHLLFMLTPEPAHCKQAGKRLLPHAGAGPPPPTPPGLACEARTTQTAAPICGPCTCPLYTVHVHRMDNSLLHLRRNYHTACEPCTCCQTVDQVSAPEWLHQLSPPRCNSTTTCTAGLHEQGPGCRPSSRLLLLTAVANACWYTTQRGGTATAGCNPPYPPHAPPAHQPGMLPSPLLQHVAYNVLLATGCGVTQAPTAVIRQWQSAWLLVLPVNCS
jgi:hypothetical protein